MKPKDLDNIINASEKKINPTVDQIIKQVFEATDPKLVIDDADFGTPWSPSGKFVQNENLVVVSMHIDNQPKGRTNFYSTIDLERNLMFIHGVHPYDLTDYFYAYSEFSERDAFGLWRFVTEGKNRRIIGEPINTNDIYEVCLKLRELDNTKQAHIDTN